MNTRISKSSHRKPSSQVIRNAVLVALVFSISCKSAFCVRVKEDRREEVTECVVSTHADSGMNGVAYVLNGRAAFQRGLFRQEITKVTEDGKILLKHGDSTIEGGQLSSDSMTVTYLPGLVFQSSKLDGGQVAVQSNQLISRFLYQENSCSSADIASGIVALFTLMYPPKEGSHAH